MIKLSEMFRNPALKAAFEKAERDNGNEFAVRRTVNPKFLGGAAASLRWRMELEAA